MVNREDKAKSKNWVDGDTFVLKIHIRKNTKFINDRYFNEYPTFEGKYLILICTDVPSWDLKKINKDKIKMKVFRAKLFDTLPTTLEEIEQQEYIKISARNYDRELYLYPDIVGKLKPDEYNLIYQYIFKLYIHEDKTVRSLKYIGNFSFTKPFQEYIPDDPFRGVSCTLSNGLAMDMLDSYINYNIKRSSCYKKKDAKLAKEKLSKWIEEENSIKEIVDSVSKMSDEEIMEKFGFEDEVPHESETYVGEERNFKE